MQIQYLSYRAGPGWGQKKKTLIAISAFVLLMWSASYAGSAKVTNPRLNALTPAFGAV